MRIKSHARRPGFALIELLVVITVVVVFLGMSAGLIHLLLKLDRGGRTASDLANDMARLASDFRRDAHASAPLELSGGTSPTMIFTIADGRKVEYLVRSGDIVRTLREGDKVRHYDLYRRPINASIRFELTIEGPARFATLVIDRPIDGRENSLYRDFRIEAELGRDQRWIGGSQ